MALNYLVTRSHNHIQTLSFGSGCYLLFYGGVEKHRVEVEYT